MRNNIIATLIFAAFIPAASFTDAEEMLRISGKNIIKKKSRGDVMFPHERHYAGGLDCLVCHHRYEKGKNILTVDELLPGSQAVTCASCHKPGRDLEKAYHRMCITCHRNNIKNKIRSGPVMCGLCHIKKGK